MIRFLFPQILWALLALPVLAWWWNRRGRNAAVLFSAISLLDKAGAASKNRLGGWQWLLRLLTLALLIVAIARPQYGKASLDVDASGIDIMLALDCSGSMQTPDYVEQGRPISRLQAVKEVVARFVQERPNDRIGLVAFAAYPYLVCPLTLDHDWLLLRLEDVNTGKFEDGTAIGSGIASGINRLEKQGGKSRIIILLTDGMNNRGRITPGTAAEAARALGIKVYTIGAGSQEQQEIDEGILRDIADKTGAKYYRADTTDALQRIYAEINRLETTRRVIHKFELQREFFPDLVLAALLFLGLEFAINEIWKRRLP